MWDLPGFLLKVEFDFETKLKRWIKGGREFGVKQNPAALWLERHLCFW